MLRWCIYIIILYSYLLHRVLVAHYDATGCVVEDELGSC
jgi:hypothetical protein